jgi:hypothetical protein
MIRHSRSGPSVMLKTTLMTALLLGAAAAGAQTPATPDDAKAPATKPAASDSSQVGFHDLICKPNGTEDGFDCADEATPAKIVPIPSQVLWPKRQDEPVSS